MSKILNTQPGDKTVHRLLYLARMGFDNREEELQELSAYFAALTARVTELEAGLKPFAHDDLCEKLSGNFDGDKSIIFQRNDAVITLSDCRNARRLLTPAPTRAEE